ncbi:MAG: response regulator transcription factor [Pirellulales bacterium]|jgi:two-component system, OmpR family, response regulator|nr:response regulator transcription factor [Pirellulales bacterium]
MRVLIVEDEPDLTRVLRQALTESGFSVDTAADGEEGLWKAKQTDYDAVILDLMLPRMQGGEVLRELRESKITPVLVLTARDAPTDKITNLNLGADDYLTKPFDLDELIARVRALIRRSTNHPSPVLRAGEVELDTSARVVRRQGQHVELAVKEYAILELLMMHQDKLVTRTMIYEHVYGEDDGTLSNVVDVYICNLRKKLGGDLINTRRGEGYIIRG